MGIVCAVPPSDENGSMIAYYCSGKRVVIVVVDVLYGNLQDVQRVGSS